MDVKDFAAQTVQLRCSASESILMIHLGLGSKLGVDVFRPMILVAADCDEILAVVPAVGRTALSLRRKVKALQSSQPQEEVRWIPYLQHTGIFRIIEITFGEETEICRGTDAECSEVFESRGDRMEQMYHDTNPDALTGSCWLDTNTVGR